MHAYVFNDYGLIKKGHINIINTICLDNKIEKNIYIDLRHKKISPFCQNFYLNEKKESPTYQI
jgi:hypothetical protein